MEHSYDINKIMAEMELELIKSYKRNMNRHLGEEVKEGFKWDMWQQKKMAGLRAFNKQSRQTVDKYTKRAKSVVTGQIINNYQDGKHIADAVIKDALRTGVDDALSFGKVDERKMNAIVDAVTNDFGNASVATLRKAEDAYRQIIYKTQVSFAAGASTLSQAVDMASKDFLSKGINAIKYKNGSNVNIASYSEMVLRTSNKKAYLTGQGARNEELGVRMVQITSYGACSDTCLPWQGRVFVDDVYSNGKKEGLGESLLSMAMEGGLFHPNCRHTSQPFFPGISEPQKHIYNTPNEKTAKIKENYQKEQRQREIERNIRKYKRIKEGSIDPKNISAAGAKVKQWQVEMRRHLKENPMLSRNSARERGLGVPYKPNKVVPHGVIPEPPKPAPKPKKVPVRIDEVEWRGNYETLEQAKRGVTKEYSSMVSNMDEKIKASLIDNQDKLDLRPNVGGGGFFRPPPKLQRGRKKYGETHWDIKEDSAPDNRTGQHATFFHEVGHAIDSIKGKVSQNPAYVDAIYKDYEDIRNKYSGFNSRIASQILAEGHLGSGVQDVLGGLSQRQIEVRWGHSLEYWNRGRVEHEVSSELFAHMFSASANPKIARIMKEWFPTAWKEFHKLF